MLFVPFGFLLALLLVRRWWLSMLIAFAVSCSIELGQLLFISARTATLADVAVNTLGAVVGAVLARLLLTARRRATATSSCR